MNPTAPVPEIVAETPPVIKQHGLTGGADSLATAASFAIELPADCVPSKTSRTAALLPAQSPTARIFALRTARIKSALDVTFIVFAIYVFKNYFVIFSTHPHPRKGAEGIENYDATETPVVAKVGTAPST